MVADASTRLMYFTTRNTVLFNYLLYCLKNGVSILFKQVIPMYCVRKFVKNASLVVHDVINL